MVFESHDKAAEKNQCETLLIGYAAFNFSRKYSYRDFEWDIEYMRTEQACQIRW